MPSQTRSASVFGERVLRALFIWFPFIIILSVYPKLWKCQPLAWPYCRFFLKIFRLRSGESRRWSPWFVYVN
jgi:hypothetical protein